MDTMGMGTAARERLGAAALELVGAPFRMHGRSAVTGLDCVGVAIVALKRVGCVATIPDDYHLRGGSLERFDQWAWQCGLETAGPQGAATAGDVILCMPGPHQFHVLVDAGSVLVHAHLGLRRVTATPKPVTWPVMRRWRLPERS